MTENYGGDDSWMHEREEWLLRAEAETSAEVGRLIDEAAKFLHGRQPQGEWWDLARALAGREPTGGPTASAPKAATIGDTEEADHTTLSSWFAERSEEPPTTLLGFLVASVPAMTLLGGFSGLLVGLAPFMF